MTSDASSKDPLRHESHGHGVAAGADMRYVLIALGLIGTFMIGEIVAALVSGSLVLFADAGHMLTDVGALGLSAWAIHLAARPASRKWTYGLKRVEILSAAANGVALVLIGLTIGIEAVARLISPHDVGGGFILIVAVVGMAVNLVAAWVLAKANRTSLNIKGAYAHVSTDLYAFVGTAIAGLIIVLTSWQRADSVAALVVVALIAGTAWGLLRDAGRILLQAVPDNLDLVDVRTHLVEVPHVIGVHDLHAWTVTSGSPTLSAHVVVEDHCFETGHAPQVLDDLQACLALHFGVTHVTFQLETSAHDAHEDIACE
ncbi:MAG TPA: cation diffusion facilitator family transporter [Acidimicrobiales bacterium]|nr:cation diffusion facilitator family transporter [Acidimicrobiales bacterium]